MSANASVEIREIWKYYGDYPALRDITINVFPGQCLALLGRNGAGKTTLLRVAAGLSKSSKGERTLEVVERRYQNQRRYRLAGARHRCLR